MMLYSFLSTAGISKIENEKTPKQSDVQNRIRWIIKCSWERGWCLIYCIMYILQYQDGNSKNWSVFFSNVNMYADLNDKILSGWLIYLNQCSLKKSK
jgi:hypothetical protein